MTAYTPHDWIDVGAVEDVPLRGARVVHTASGDIAVFRTGEGKIFALRDRCPHKNGPLSQGIVHDDGVTCPLHNWVIDLATGQARGADVGCTGVIAVRTERGRIHLGLAALAGRVA
jgi:nitrite reductase (NADH) small subunit